MYPKINDNLTSEVNKKMTDLTTTFNTANTTKEMRVKELKRHVERWRELIVLANSVLIWEQTWYPGLLVAISSVSFFTLWVLDPSLLTTISFVFLLTILLEAFVPSLCTALFNAADWTGSKERQLEEVCRSIVETKFFIHSHWNNIQQMKTSQPKLYYSVTIAVLVFLVWLGNLDNLFLSYVFVTGLLMVPGLLHHGIIQKYYRASLLAVASLLRSVTREKEKSK